MAKSSYTNLINILIFIILLIMLLLIIRCFSIKNVNIEEYRGGGGSRGGFSGGSRGGFGGGSRGGFSGGSRGGFSGGSRGELGGGSRGGFGGGGSRGVRTPQKNWNKAALGGGAAIGGAHLLNKNKNYDHNKHAKHGKHYKHHNNHNWNPYIAPALIGGYLGGNYYGDYWDDYQEPIYVTQPVIIDQVPIYRNVIGEENNYYN